MSHLSLYISVLWDVCKIYPNQRVFYKCSYENSTHLNDHSLLLDSNIVSYSHYNDVIMTTMASQITSLTIVYSTFYSGADERKHQSSASLAFVWGNHRGPVNSPHKWTVTRKCFHLMTSSCLRQTKNEYIMPKMNYCFWEVFLYTWRALQMSFVVFFFLFFREWNEHPDFIPCFLLEIR